jgi:hypothetical protein
VAIAAGGFGRRNNETVGLVARNAALVWLWACLGYTLGLFSVTILATAQRRCSRIAVGTMAPETTCSGMSRGTGGRKEPHLLGVASGADFSIGVRCRVWVMATNTIAVRCRRAGKVCEAILVAFDASVRVWKCTVDFVTIGARLVSFWTARQQQLSLGFVTLHAAAALGMPSMW